MNFEEITNTSDEFLCKTLDSDDRNSKESYEIEILKEEVKTLQKSFYEISEYKNKQAQEIKQLKKEHSELIKKNLEDNPSNPNAPVNRVRVERGGPFASPGAQPEAYVVDLKYQSIPQQCVLTQVVESGQPNILYPQLDMLQSAKNTLTTNTALEFDSKQVNVFMPICLELAPAIVRVELPSYFLNSMRTGNHVNSIDIGNTLGKEFAKQINEAFFNQNFTPNLNNRFRGIESVFAAKNAQNTDIVQYSDQTHMSLLILILSMKLRQNMNLDIDDPLVVFMSPIAYMLLRLYAASEYKADGERYHKNVEHEIHISPLLSTRINPEEEGSPTDETIIICSPKNAYFMAYQDAIHEKDILSSSQNESRSYSYFCGGRILNQNAWHFLVLKNVTKQIAYGKSSSQ